MSVSNKVKVDVMGSNKKEENISYWKIWGLRICNKPSINAQKRI